MSTSDTMTCVGTYFGLSGRVLHILWRHKQTTLNRFDCLSSIVCYYKNMSKSTSVPYMLSPRLIMPLSQKTLPHQKIECHNIRKSEIIGNKTIRLWKADKPSGIVTYAKPLPHDGFDIIFRMQRPPRGIGRQNQERCGGVLKLELTSVLVVAGSVDLEFTREE